MAPARLRAGGHLKFLFIGPPPSGGTLLVADFGLSSPPIFRSEHTHALGHSNVGLAEARGPCWRSTPPQGPGMDVGLSCSILTGPFAQRLYIFSGSCLPHRLRVLPVVLRDASSGRNRRRSLIGACFTPHRHHRTLHGGISRPVRLCASALALPSAPNNPPRIRRRDDGVHRQYRHS